MNPLDFQTTYWDSVASEKTFSHPVHAETFRKWVRPEEKILDYGCGYGRTCAELTNNGYRHVTGVDISRQMITRGLAANPALDLRHNDAEALPFPHHSFSACTLLAVLTCIPTDAGQRQVIGEIARVLRPGGVLYLSDYPLQSDERNTARYRQHEAEYEKYGVFGLPEGAVVRHHEMPWIHELLSSFELLQEQTIEVATMNGNKATIFQIIAKKPERQETTSAKEHATL
ncbi:class I SAM-dependent methyltransferase [Desulfoluna spongiiphila]|uniref:Methyltransferase domain-containing protein n=1 Tax=Desulfoluna spongiiphila TaxID=419481 RepID=A0A1G5GD60_9BACT|nr:class I SAM-dependent methyltransferase [Desulfoluna spongiiphila]SCY49493.1 Methyltransferase domain-containing protein [Desulfoluna spongiiphila]VVS93627.1 s-adenosyl-l-methionine-dependent methyltransferase [Desulfoluna spongiiphila]